MNVQIFVNSCVSLKKEKQLLQNLSHFENERTFWKSTTFWKWKLITKSILTSGTIAILSAQPTDVVKIRMQAELIKPGEKSRYNGVMHAYKTVFKEEGIAGKIRLEYKVKTI